MRSVAILAYFFICWGAQPKVAKATTLSLCEENTQLMRTESTESSRSFFRLARRNTSAGAQSFQVSLCDPTKADYADDRLNFYGL